MKRSIKLLSILVIINMAFSSVGIISVHAQDPVDWQNSATGLSVNDINSGKTTAGLGFQVYVEANRLPYIILPGGVQISSGSLFGPSGIRLGNVKNAGDTSATLASEATDWSHNELTFSANTGQLKLWVSRLTPAILVQSLSNTVRLFSNNATGNLRYIAYQSSGQVQVRNLTQSNLSLPSLDKNWMLLWYGSNSQFYETKKPLTYTSHSCYWGRMPQEYAYQADAPMLIVFQNLPKAIKISSEGGVDISFNASAGLFSFSPLFGREHLNAVDTERWATGFPPEILNQSTWWARRLCDYPTGANETYGYDAGADISIITENINYINVCAGGIKFSPIPPVLSIVKNTLHVNFSAPVVSGNLNTEFGPYYGIENVDTYNWQVSNLKKYVDAERIYPDGTPPGMPADLEQELEAQIGEMINAGHLDPWIFTDALPRHVYRGDIYWLNPADEISQLVGIATALPDGDVKSQLVNYIKSERNAYPPEDIYNLPLDTGNPRTGFASTGPDTFAALADRTDVFLKNVPLYSFYALAQYYKLTGEPVPPGVSQKAVDALDRDMREQDWASFYWFKGYADRRDAVVNANRLFSGLVGFTRLAKISGAAEYENLGRALLAKAAVLRLAMAEYPRYLYSSGLTDFPPSPDWQVSLTAGYFQGHLYNYNWVDGSDDARQVAMVNQFGVYLDDHSGYVEPLQPVQPVWNTAVTSAHLTPYRDMTPELARFINKFALPDVGAFNHLVKTMYPNWYAAFAEGTLGEEHNLSHPTDSFQMFMAEALIEGATPGELASYIDIPWVTVGDLFYLTKLAETINAYRQVVWDDSVILTASPGENRIDLYWNVFITLPDTITWRIEYSGPPGNPPSPITGIPSTQHQYTLSSLTNLARYTITVKAMMGTTTFMSSDTISVTPGMSMTYFPLIYRRW